MGGRAESIVDGLGVEAKIPREALVVGTGVMVGVAGDERSVAWWVRI